MLGASQQRGGQHGDAEHEDDSGQNPGGAEAPLARRRRRRTGRLGSDCFIDRSAARWHARGFLVGPEWRGGRIGRRHFAAGGAAIDLGPELVGVAWLRSEVIAAS